MTNDCEKAMIRPSGRYVACQHAGELASDPGGLAPHSESVWLSGLLCLGVK